MEKSVENLKCQAAEKLNIIIPGARAFIYHSIVAEHKVVVFNSY